ncbi:MAG: universal stress protein, partial [Deltaproteobacteria bacterium]|nr:universal stress protein [Deltaproteobacteria bacterium]
MIKNILLPMDGSDFSKTAIDYGIYIAKKFNAHLTGLHVMDVRLMQVSTLNDVSETGVQSINNPLLPTIEQGLNEKADSILEDFQDICRAAHIQVRVQKSLGIVSDTVIEEGGQADCILLAQRGEHFRIGSGGILGSTVESVVRKANKPVLVTPSGFQEIESMGLAYDGSPPAEKALKLAVEISEQAAWPLSIIIITNDQHLSADLTARVEAYITAFEKEDERKIDSDVIILSGKEDREILRFILDGSVELMV